jgi:hypothetical protein
LVITLATNLNAQAPWPLVGTLVMEVREQDQWPSVNMPVISTKAITQWPLDLSQDMAAVVPDAIKDIMP